MQVYQNHDEVIVEGVKAFNLQHIFECGQCFRWEKEENGSYTGVVYGRVINIRNDGETIILSNTNMQDFHVIWKSYFDLERDYRAIQACLSKDESMKKAVAFGWGIRILNQDVWECLVSFIISSNNIIPRIQKIIKSLSEKYGQPILFNGKTYYSFPRPEDVYQKNLEELAFCKSGYRCKYILDAARKIVEGNINIEALTALSTFEAREELMKIKGVGPKVADCVLLFSLQKYDVFPTDVWIRRIVAYLYFGHSITIKDVQKFAIERFGSLGGFAQQYLFYYARELKIGK